MRYALIQNNMVVNTIEADAEFAASITDFTVVEINDTVGIGFTYDGSNFTAPEIVPGPPIEITYPPHITLLALNLRFTRQERDAIRAAKITDGDVSDVMYLMEQANYIDLSRAETIGGIQMLEAKGLLAPGRAATVLNTETATQERP